MTFDISKIKIPSNPGTYLMKDSEGSIIYIGKAKNLKNRVRSYFIKNQNYKTQKLVEQISSIEFIITDNESEAFLLESNLIKKYRPKYNIELKDQQRYTYLRITDEEFPRLVVARRTRNGNFLGRGKIFGPFTHGSSKLLTIGTLRKTFQIRICKTLPKKACLEYHLGNCEAPCEFSKAKDNYKNHIQDLEDVLKGKDQMQTFVTKLKQEMAHSSEHQDYERAKELRDTLFRLESLQTKQKIEYTENADEEYFGISISDQSATIMTFRMINGVIRDSDKYSFDLVGDNDFGNFLFQYYTTHKIPQVIVVNEMPKNHELIQSLLERESGNKIQILIPKGGRRRAVIELILKNLHLLGSSNIDPALLELGQVLGMEKTPRIIECFDISNHGDEFAVGSMSQFVDGMPNKSGYRKFRIKTVLGRDDFAMMGEIIKRRYYRLAEEKGHLPDLVLIDGGIGQLNAAIKSLESVKVSIPCISLAKENEEIYFPKNKTPLILEKEKASLKILQHARDEAHRFGVSYNRQIRRAKIKN